MNMMGAFGSFACSLAFPYALRSTGRATAFYLLAAALNIAAMVCWFGLGWGGREKRKAIEQSNLA
jgi:nitrate/nitrite transporter NarK